MIIKEGNHILSFYRSVGKGVLEELSHASKIPTYGTLLNYFSNMHVINIEDVSRSVRFNPIQLKYIPTLQDAIAFSEKLGFCRCGFWETTPNIFFERSAVNLLAACVWFFMNYKILPYSESGDVLFPEYYDDPSTGQKRPTGRVFKSLEYLQEAEEDRRHGRRWSLGSVTPAYWLGKYSDLPHVLSFLNMDYETMFCTLETNPECLPLLGPFMTALRNRSMDQLEAMISTLKIHVSRLVNKELFWILHRDGDDFDLSDKWNRDYVMLIAKANQSSLLSFVSSVIAGVVPSFSDPQNFWSYKDTLKGSYRTIEEALEIEPYVFSSPEEKERVLYANYNRVWIDVNNMIDEIKKQFTKDDKT